MPPTHAQDRRQANNTSTMRLAFPSVSLLLALGISVVVDSFTAPCRRPQILLSSPSSHHTPRQRQSAALGSGHTTTTTLYAKKKSPGNKAKDAALAALEAMEQQESLATGTTTTTTAAPPATAATQKPNNAAATKALDFLLDDDAPLTKKEQMELEKKRQKEAKKAKQDSDRMAAAEMEEIEKNKRKKALKALAEMEAMEKSEAGMVMKNSEEAGGVNGDAMDNAGESSTTMSKKEAKMAAKKAEKEAEKQAMKTNAKEAKKLGITVEELMERRTTAEEETEASSSELETKSTTTTSINGADSSTEGVTNGRINGDASSDDEETTNIASEQRPTETAEERIRKERPPPRIRIMETSQPDYTALRLENIAITFRDQPVLKSATWGVQTGDRIGLVGANGAGKTTQLRILAGELEPTAGDVVKSHKDLRVAMLRQEFIDEIDLTRTLREEFISVFTEEAEIMAQLSQAEKELEGMTGDAADAEAMQEVLDRMAKLQVKADSKNVNVLDSRVSKIMDLMGFDPEEGGKRVYLIVSLFLYILFVAHSYV
jgi:ABC-type molybdenum transport system ATPase subunit/photorepair protein PhrA